MTTVEARPQATAVEPLTLRRRLRADAAATVENGPDGRTVLWLRCSRHEVPLAGLGRAAQAAVLALAASPLSDAELVRVAELAEPEAGMTALLRTNVLVGRLAAAGWLDEVTCSADTAVATLHPSLIGAQPPPPPLPARPRLSRFTALVPADGGLRAGSPLASAEVTLQTPAAVTAALALCGGALDLRGSAPDPSPVAGAVTALLARAGLLAVDDEDAAPASAQWSATDLRFHASSRAGRSLAGYGGTYALRDRVPELPVVAEPTGPLVALTVPDLAAGPAASVPFGDVLEARRSVREHDDAAPITEAQLAELLYRTLRERRRVVDAEGAELSDRPWPNGGALYELEVYPVITRCAGLPAGVHRYLPDRHGLELVAQDSPALRDFVGLVGATGLFTAPPQVALVVTARFGRVMRKYESMAYALVLKHVGVLYQTWYLAATALGLAPCALGGGSADAFATLTGRSYLEESSVGEFLVGSRPAAR